MSAERARLVALGLFVLAILTAAWMSRYAIVPNEAGLIGAWRLDRWTGEACLVPLTTHGDGAEGFTFGARRVCRMPISPEVKAAVEEAEDWLREELDDNP